jgi:hypothetical protein
MASHRKVFALDTVIDMKLFFLRSIGDRRVSMPS